MRQYYPEEITEFAKAKAAEYPLKWIKALPCKEPSFDRRPKGVKERPGERTKIKALGKDSIQLNRENIDLRYVEQLVDSEQLNTLGQIVRFLEEEIFDGRKTLGQAIEQVENVLDKKGLAGVCEGNTVPGNLARPPVYRKSMPV